MYVDFLSFVIALQKKAPPNEVTPEGALFFWPIRLRLFRAQVRTAPSQQTKIGQVY